jgi:uncharacterized protein YkwD
MRPNVGSGPKIGNLGREDPASRRCGDPPSRQDPRCLVAAGAFTALMQGRVAILGVLLAAGAVRGDDAPPAREPPIRFHFEVSLAKAPAVENFTLAELDAALVAETNRVRQANGCRPLRELPALAAAADDQATFMALTMTVTHVSPIKGQRDVIERTQSHGLLEASLLAENALSIGFRAEQAQPLSCAEVATRLIAQWMDSPGHRANLLNRKFTDVGCAARRLRFFGGVENFFATQVFAAR